MLAYTQSKDLSVLGEANWYYNSTSYGPHLSMTRAFAKTYLNADGSIYNEKKANGTYKTFSEETVGRDARFCQTIRGADYTRKDKSGSFVKTAADMSLSLTGYQYTKYVMDDSGYDNARSNDNDVPLLRYAEVLLNYAEAKAELGTITADDWTKTIGALRRRAGITGGDLDKLPTTVDTYLQKTFYPNVTSPVILEVRRDRAIELILEGFRMNDLKRWACGKDWQDAPWDGIYIAALDTPIDLNGDGVNDVYVTADANYQKSGTYKAIAMTLNSNQKANKIAAYYESNPKTYPIQLVTAAIFPYFANLMLAFYAPDKSDSGIAEQLDLKSTWGVRDYTTGMRNYTATQTMQIINAIRRYDGKSKGVDATGNTGEGLLKELLYIILH